MLRKLIVFSLTAFLLLLATTLPLFAESVEPREASDCVSLAENERVTAHLETKESVNWYTFEMKTDGDAMICVSVQGNWTTFYQWTLTVIDSDKMTELQSVNVQDSANTTTLCLNDLKKGTYYIKIGATNHFSDKEYTVAIYTSNPAGLPEGDKNSVRLMDEPGLICQIDGHSFVKTNPGEAYAALYRNPEGAIVPILIGKEKSAVEYVFLDTGDIVTSVGTFEIDGEIYYATNADWLDKYTSKLSYQKYTEDQLYLSEEQHKVCEDTVKDIMNRLEMNEKGVLWYFISNYWWLVLLFIGIGVFLFFLFGTKGSGDDSGGYGGGGGGFVPPPDDDSDAWGRPAGTSGPPVSGEGI